MADGPINSCTRYLLCKANVLLILGWLTVCGIRTWILADEKTYIKATRFPITKEQLTVNQEMNARTRYIYEEDLAIFGFELFILGIHIIVIQLIQRFLLGVNNFLNKLLMYGSILSYCIGMVMITRENALIKLSAFIMGTTDDDFIIGTSDDDGRENLKIQIPTTSIVLITLFGYLLILVSTQIFYVVLVWKYSKCLIKALSLVLMLGSLYLLYIGSWIVIDKRTSIEPYNFESEKTKANLSANDEQMEVLYPLVLTLFDYTIIDTRIIGPELVLAGIVGFVIGLLELCGKLNGNRRLLIALNIMDYYVMDMATFGPELVIGMVGFGISLLEFCGKLNLETTMKSWLLLVCIHRICTTYQNNHVSLCRLQICDYSSEL